ncbi:hypothetical protein ABE069_24635 [Bacillus mycoides]
MVVVIFKLVKTEVSPIKGYKRNDISLRKFILLSSVSIVIGCLVSFVLPFGYEKIFDYIN